VKQSIQSVQSLIFAGETTAFPRFFSNLPHFFCGLSSALPGDEGEGSRQGRGSKTFFGLFPMGNPLLGESIVFFVIFFFGSLSKSN
jgi:hypothetical protein